MNRSCRLRIRSVKWKNGGEVRMLPELGSKERKDAKERIAELSDSMIGSPGGFAFLIWNTLGETWVDLQNYNGPVTSAMIPDFSKSHLHAEMTMRWTVERLKGHS